LICAVDFGIQLVQRTGRRFATVPKQLCMKQRGFHSLRIANREKEGVFILDTNRVLPLYIVCLNPSE
jgi:hypothetical protein